MLILYKKKAFRQFKCRVKSLGGRDSSGRITVYHRGGGVLKQIRIIDYKRYIWNTPGIILRLEYNPASNSVLALISYLNGIFSYIVCPHKIRVGDVLCNTTMPNLNSTGCAVPIKNIPVGTFVHHIELRRFYGAQLLRSFGSYGRIMAKTSSGVIVKLKSSKQIVIQSSNSAVVGILLPDLFKQKIHNKAGFFRRKGFRPIVRGVAMNPIDHPHGGGEGKSSAGRPSVSRWAWLTKNVKGYRKN
jgi:large subunit ribosomal protein L2